MSQTDEIDAILRHLRRELGDADPAPPVSGNAAPETGLDMCLRDIRSPCGSRRDRHRFLGDLFAPVLIGIAVCVGLALSA